MTTTAAEFAVGDAVVLHGLRQAVHLNGRRAVVHEGLDGGRQKVRILDDPTNASTPAVQLLISTMPMSAILPKNMALDYAVGTRVVLRDLVRTANLNGTVVTVTGFCRRRCRFIVEMPAEEEEDEDTNNGKQEDANGTRDDVNENANQSMDVISAPTDAEKEKEKEDGDEDTNNGEHENADQSTDGSSGDSSSPTVKKARPNTPNAKAPKQQVVKPANVTHLPGCRPGPVPVCEQRLIFTGSMASITRVLDHSPHRPNPGTAGSFAHLLGTGAPTVSNRYWLLSDSMDNEAATMMAALDLWAKIMARSYASTKASDQSAEAEGEGDDGDTLPPFYQKLVQVSDEHTHKICFNPSCRRHFLPCTQQKMKRCTNW